MRFGEVAMEAADLRVPDIPLASCDDDDIDSNKNLSNHSSDEKHHCNSNSDEERLHDEFSGSLEDLVGNFDEKIAACLKDHEVTTADIAPVQIRTQEEVMNESQTWWTLTGNFGNIQPLDFGTSSICKKMAAALDSDSLKDDASTRRSMTNSDDEDLLRQQMDVHQMIGHHHGSTDTGGETPPQTADQVIEEIDEMLQNTVARHISSKLHIFFESLSEQEKLPKQLVIGGGVAANQYIFGAISKLSAAHNVTTIKVLLSLCTDNAEMIAYSGLLMLVNRSEAIWWRPNDIPDTIYAHARSDIGTDASSEIIDTPRRKLVTSTIHGTERIRFRNLDDFKKPKSPKTTE